MSDAAFVQAKQRGAIIREYNDALRDGNYGLASRIRKANPDIIDNDSLAWMPEPPVKSPVLPRKDWKVVLASTGSLERDLNKLSEEGYYPFQIVPQKGAYGIAHYTIIAGDLTGKR